MTKSLYERVLEWENLHGLDGGECYKPYFNDALMIAKRLGYKPYGSKDGSSFGTLYTDGQVVAVLAGLDAKYGKEEKA